MEKVTVESIDHFVSLYSVARGGETNEETESEAMFVLATKYKGAYLLSTWPAPLWIGVQNAKARWSTNGKPFASVRAAIEAVLTAHDPESLHLAVYYSTDSVERLRWLADQIEANKAAGDFLLYG